LLVREGGLSGREKQTSVVYVTPIRPGAPTTDDTGGKQGKKKYLEPSSKGRGVLVVLEKTLPIPSGSEAGGY